MKKILLLVLLSFFIAIKSYASADNGFIVKHVSVIGLARIKLETLYHYLPLQLGQRVDAKKSSEIIKSLYQSGFFSNITLTRDHDTLTIVVVERPVITAIHISGNKSIKTQDLLKALRKSGVARGFEYNPSIVDEIKNILLQQYFAQGKYNAKVAMSVKLLAHQRIILSIAIFEGSVAKIKKITILGHHSFSDKVLLDQFKLSVPNLLSFFTHNDVYSHQKLATDLAHLRLFYLDHGYLKYKLKSSHVAITPSRDQIYIVINIAEGVKYRIKRYRFTGKPTLSLSKLQALVSLKIGEVFSRQKVINAQRAIMIALGDKGYARAQVNIIPKIDDHTREVTLIFNIIPGRRIYVRHISFSDNYRTNDKALRRNILQLEGALSSTKLIDESQHQLLLLPYIRNVVVTRTFIPQKPNQEDINYQIAEYPAAVFNAGVGYSDVDGVLFNVSLNQKNFLGSGNAFNFGFTRSAALTSYHIGYYNPHYTLSNIGRDINFYYSHYNAKKVDIASYATNDIGITVNYSIPISPRASYLVGYGYQNTLVELGNLASTQLQAYLKRYGSHFYQPIINVGWNYDGFDRAIMPTQGLYQNLGLSVTLPISAKSLRYYQASYNIQYYHPIYHRSWLAKFKSDISFGHGYGRYSGRYPFFRNFYAGGMGSVRGYEGNSLGPRDSNGDPLGGNMLIDASVGVVFPNPISHSVRTTWFIDGGNVFDSNGPGHTLGISGVDLHNIRYSTGLELDWLSPIGITLKFALAKAINPGKGDKTQFFSFNIGAGI